MARTARPSDIYRLPEQIAHPRPGADAPPPRGPRPPPRRFPAWMWVAVALAVVLVVSGLVGGGGSAPTSGDAPVVDIISEDQAIAALALYGAQANAIGDLRDRRLIFSGGGPPAAAGAAGRGAAAVQRTLDAARRVNNPDPLYTAYVGNGAHVATQQRLADASATGNTIALLAATHDTIYSGNGAIALDDAYRRINGAVNTGRAPGPIERWGEALLQQMEKGPSAATVNAAIAGRDECGQYWASLVDALEPGAVAELQTYIDGLPGATVDGLRGHPVAGPALKTLEEGTRQISTDTTTPSGRR